MITHCTISDTSTVTLNGADGSVVVSGPLEVDCYSVTVAGIDYKGSVLVNSGTAFRLLEFTPRMMDLYDPAIAFSFLLGLICARFRL